MIERSPGVGTGQYGFIAGGGYKGHTSSLDDAVVLAAETLSAAYDHPVIIRFNSDRRSGGAWLKTDDPDGIWLNAEVGICALQRFANEEEKQLEIERITSKYGAEHELVTILSDFKPGEILFYAHVGERVGTKAHEKTAGIPEALAYLKANADLSRLS